jgi:capsular exopolysaccharide synthesis family protein
MRKEKLLASAYAAQSKQVSGESEKAIQYNILKREVDSNRSLYDTMLQQLKQSTIAAAMRASNIRVVDPAKIPSRPYKPDMPVSTGLGLLTGIFLGAAFIIMRERADRSIQQPGDTPFYLNIPELGIIPAGASDPITKKLFRRRRVAVTEGVSTNGKKPGSVLALERGIEESREGGLEGGRRGVGHDGQVVKPDADASRVLGDRPSSMSNEGVLPGEGVRGHEGVVLGEGVRSNEGVVFGEGVRSNEGVVLGEGVRSNEGVQPESLMMQGVKPGPDSTVPSDSTPEGTTESSTRVDSAVCPRFSGAESARSGEKIGANEGALLAEGLTTAEGAPLPDGLRNNAHSAFSGPKNPLPTDQCVELVTWQRKPSILAESFRSALISILFTGENGSRPKVLVLTSSGPAEGKSTVVSNLGIAIAEVGQKVLIIDADMRKPRMHNIFGMTNERGLSDILRQRITLNGDPSLSGLIRETEIPNLFVLPSGSSTSTATNLLYGNYMPELLRHLRAEFETILIDTPPMLQIPDARVLGRLADQVILVIRAGKTTRDAAVAARHRFSEDGTKLMGTILNDWNPKHSPTGYYGYYNGYYRNYARYYSNSHSGE